MAELIELIEGLRAVNAGPLEMARIVETLTPMLIAINVRYKTHAGIRITGLPDGDPWAVSEIERCVVLAGGTGGAKLAAGMQELLGEGLSVIANTADDVEVLGVDVSPDPDLITYWLSGEIDEERGWGIKGDSFTVFERLVAARRPGLVQPLGPRPGHLPLPAQLRRRGRRAAPTRRPRSPARLGCAQRCCRCASSRFAPGCRTPAGWRGPPGVPDRRPRRAADRGGRARGDRRGRAHARGARGDRGRRGDRDRPLEPGDLDRPDPRRRRHARGDRGRRSPGGRGQPLRRRARSSRDRPTPSCRRSGGRRPRPASPPSTRA